jgi:ubiquinone/menaquinone biosynthesis C-methylase UbiE
MKVTSTQEVREFYDGAANSYNEMMDEEIALPMYAKVLGALAKQITARDGGVLDTACGSGHMLELLKDKYAQGRALYGVDLSPAMAAISRQRLGDAATIVEGDMGDLRHLGDDSCAAVLNYFALHHVDLAKMFACFAEWHRVLKQGGTLLVATWAGEGCIDYGEELDVIALRYQPEQVTEAASAAGFRINSITVEPVQGMEMNAVNLTASK